MDAFYQTPLDLLYLVLTISIGILFALTSLVLYHFIRILKNINRVTNLTENTVELINHYLWQPIKFLQSILEKTKAHTEKAASKAAKKASKGKN